MSQQDISPQQLICEAQTRMIVVSMESRFPKYQETYLPVDHEIVKKVGAESAIAFAMLARRYKRYEDDGFLINIKNYGDGWFPYSEFDMYHELKMGPKKQEKVIKSLIELGLIERVCFLTTDFTPDDNQLEARYFKLNMPL